MISIDDLLSTVTADQQVETYLSTLETLGIPARQWKAGGVARTILRVVAITVAGFSTVLAAAIGGGFLDKAVGGWLTLLAYYVYGVTRIEATFSKGTLTLVNTGGGTYTFAAGQAKFLDPATKTTFTNDAGFTLAPTSTLDIAVTATISGSAGSSVPGGVSQLVTAMLGVTCSNATALVGLDAQSDNDLRQACRDKIGALSVRGPRNAYAWAAKAALNGGVPVNINRVSVSTSSSTGQVTVYVASPSGTPSAGDITAVADNIEANVRPEGVTVTVLAATAVPYTPTITVWAQSTQGVSAADVQTAAAKAVSDFIAAYPIGGLVQADTLARGLFASGIASVIGGASPARVFSVEGATDLALVAGQVATDGVTLNVQMATAT